MLVFHKMGLISKIPNVESLARITIYVLYSGVIYLTKLPIGDRWNTEYGSVILVFATFTINDLFAVTSLKCAFAWTTASR